MFVPDTVDGLASCERTVGAFQCLAGEDASNHLWPSDSVSI